MSAKTSSNSSTPRSDAKPRTRKTSSRTKTVRSSSEETASEKNNDTLLDDVTTKKTHKAPARRRAVKKNESSETSSVDTGNESSEETLKKTAPRKRTTASKDKTSSKKAISSADASTESSPKPRRRRTKKEEKVTSDISDEVHAVPSVEQEEQDTVPAKPRRRVTRKKAETVSTATKTIPLTPETTSSNSLATPPKKRRATRRIAVKKSSTAPSEETELSPSSELLPTQTAHVHVSAFAQLKLSPPILQAIEEMGYTQPTPIQQQAIPQILNGHDVLGVAQTGTGKTASFTLPLLEKLSKSRARARMPRSLILEPTRELALQVAENFERYGKYLRLSHALLIGGGSMNEQLQLLNRGVDVLIATPGRLLDLFNRGGLLLTQTDTLVIDEADRMLDMGFVPDIERIVSLLPPRRQTLFFSATMAPEIRRLTEAFLASPQEITIAPQSSVANSIEERFFIVGKKDKSRALYALIHTEKVQNAIIFCNRKRDVDTLSSYLKRKKLTAGHLHGDLTQTLRFETLERFRSGELKFLVCSDIAARGIDIGGLSHVFNYDLPFNAEDYVHRIGRTGRAGKKGYAFTLATPDEHPFLTAIEKLIKKPIQQDSLTGFPTLGWSDEGIDHKAHETTPQKSEPLREKRKAKKPQNSTRRVPGYGESTSSSSSKNKLLPPIPEKDGFQEGFGDYTPAFMLISFRPASCNTPNE